MSSKPLRNKTGSQPGPSGSRTNGTESTASPPAAVADIHSPPRRLRDAASIAIVVILVASAVLAFSRLSSAAFWDDEAQVGIIARNVLRTGTLSGWDGRNLYGYRDGALLDNHLQFINAPLDCLVAAASFKMLGISTWTGRFPFVLAGLVSLLVFLAILRLDFPELPENAAPARSQDRRSNRLPDRPPAMISLHVFALTAWALSPTFLLNIRNCRYYALSLAASLCMYYCYRRFSEPAPNSSVKGRESEAISQPSPSKRARPPRVPRGDEDPDPSGSPPFREGLGVGSDRPGEVARWSAAVGFAVASIASFYASYLLFAAFLLALAVVHFYFSPRGIGLRDLPKVIVSAVILAAATAPYAIRHRIWVRHDTNVQEDWLTHRATLVWWNVRDLNLMAVLPWMVAIVLAVFVIHGLRSRDAVARPALRWALLAFAYIFFLALMSIQPTSVPTIADVRYLIPAAPFAAGLSGIALWYVFARVRWLGLVTLGVFVCTNGFCLLPADLDSTFPSTSRWRWLLPAYIGEVTHPYPTGAQAVSDYLRAHAQKDDVVFCSPFYMDGPLMFTLGDRVLIGGQLDDDTNLPKARARSLNAPLFADSTFPQWLVFYSGNNSQNIYQYFSRPHVVDGKVVCCHYKTAQKLDVYCNQTQRPELPLHNFGPVTSFDRSADAVYVVHNDGLVAPDALPQQGSAAPDASTGTTTEGQPQ
ncbi:MAG: hypothetical protein ACLQVD_20770 [Capsulimonadaceae bacterium]